MEETLSYLLGRRDMTIHFHALDRDQQIKLIGMETKEEDADMLVSYHVEQYEGIAGFNEEEYRTGVLDEANEQVI